MNSTAGNETPYSCPLQNVDTIDVLSLPENEDYNRFLLLFISINALTSFLSLFSNFAVIYVILGTESLRTPSNILILGLAGSDFVSGLIAQPSYCTVRFAELQRNFSLFCSVGMVYNLSVWSLAASSLLTLTAITTDRFLAVQLHLRYQELVTTTRCGLVIVLTWILSPVISLCRLFAIPRGLIVVAAGFLAALLVVNAIFIFKISRVIHRHSVQIQAQQQSVQQSIDMPRYKKSVHTMYYVIGAFLLCYVPFLGTLVLLSVSNRTQELAYLVVVSVTLLFFNGVFNPLIYFGRIKEIRSEIYRRFNVWKGTL